MEYWNAGGFGENSREGCSLKEKNLDWGSQTSENYPYSGTSLNR